MKLHIKYLLILSGLFFSACTDVIDVDLQNADPRLTVEASLNWEKGTSGANQKIRLSTSTPYFASSQNKPVTEASVKVVNTNTNEEFIFTHNGKGEYITSSFVPILNNTYILEIEYLWEKYTGTEKMISVPDITKLSQSKENGSNDENLEINITFNDPKGEENFYLLKLHRAGEVLPELIVIEDEFVDGNEVEIVYEKEEYDITDKKEIFVTGYVVDIEFFGVSNSYYNYMRILIKQSLGLDIFSPTPVALKGNCINTTNSENYAFGYFRLTQVEKTSYTIQ